MNKIEAEPYWMSNPEWYKIEVDLDKLTGKISLTDKAPKKAVESFKEYNKKDNDISIM